MPKKLSSGDSVLFVPANNKLGKYSLRFRNKSGCVEGEVGADGKYLINFGADHIWLAREHLVFLCGNDFNDSL